MCVCMSVSVCVYLCECEYMCVCVWLGVYASVSACLCVCVCVRACVFSSKCLNVCMGKRKRDREGSEHFLLEEIFFSQQTFKFKFFKRLALPQKSQQYQNG